MNKLEQAICKTIIYFDIYHHPLTKEEVKKNIYQDIPNQSNDRIQTCLDNLTNNKILEYEEGFYFLPGHRKIIQTRKTRYLLAQKKMEIAKKNLSLLCRLPFISALFVCNNLSYQNAPAASDIDIAIITTPGRIWTTRFFSTLLMKILNRRPDKNNQKNKICLSFYLSEDNLDLKAISYKNDIHFIFWLNQFLPIYNPRGIAQKFFKNNTWTKQFLPNFFPTKTNARWSVPDKKNRVKTLVEKILQNRFGTVVENILKSCQQKFLPNELKKQASEKNTNVVISDKILKFHTKDSRQNILNRWENLVIKYLP